MIDESDDRHSPRPMSLLAAAAWTIAVGLVTAIAIQITESARPGADVDLVNITACFVLAYSALLFAMLRVYAPHAPMRQALGARDASVLGVLLAAIAGGALSVATSALDDPISKRFPPPEEETELVDRLLHMTSLRDRVVVVVSFAIAIPIFEELFFRGAIFGGLRRGRPEQAAVLASATLYALGESHGDLRLVASALVIGVVASWLRGRSGSVAPAIAAHVAYNAAPLAPFAAGHADYDFAPRVAIACAVGGALATWLAAFLFGRDRRAEGARLLDA